MRSLLALLDLREELGFSRHPTQKHNGKFADGDADRASHR